MSLTISIYSSYSCRGIQHKIALFVKHSVYHSLKFKVDQKFGFTTVLTKIINDNQMIEVKIKNSVQIYLNLVHSSQILSKTYYNSNMFCIKCNVHLKEIHSILIKNLHKPPFGFITLDTQHSHKCLVYFCVLRSGFWEAINFTLLVILSNFTQNLKHKRSA